MRPATARTARRRTLVALLLAAGVAPAGCGAPAVVKPTPPPLSGLQSDIHAAHNAVAVTERLAQGEATANPSSP